MSKRQKTLLGILSAAGNPLHIDEIARQSKLTQGECGVELTLMELLGGVVRRLPGNLYTIA